MNARQAAPFEIVDWPADMRPSATPIHFTNEREIAAPVSAIWSLLIDPATWPAFYPGVRRVTLVDSFEVVDGGRRLAHGTRFETNLAGQDVVASVQEFRPQTRIAWGGHPISSPDSVAYHAWILTPTADGCHVWTEETMRGPLWIELAKEAPDRFWAAHERLLDDLAALASRS